MAGSPSQYHVGWVGHYLAFGFGALFLAEAGRVTFWQPVAERVLSLERRSIRIIAFVVARNSASGTVGAVASTL